jgi:hypothetical protein
MSMVGPGIQSPGDYGSDELQDARADSGRHHVGGGDHGNHIRLMRTAVECSKVVDDAGLRTFADLVHVVAVGGLELCDDVVVDIGEDHLVPARVQKLGDEAATDIAGTEMDSGLVTHGWQF